MGKDRGKNRIGAVWSKFNDKVKLALCSDKCQWSVVKRGIVNGNDLSDDNTKRITCPNCNLPCRPNVLMFHDTDSSVLHHIQEQRDQYQAWEAKMEEDVAVNGRNLVIMEFGCGLNVPAVRNESEDVLIDCIEKIEHQGTSSSVTLIRINPKDAFLEEDKNRRYRSNFVSINDKSLNSLMSIDKRITMAIASQNQNY